MDWKLGLGLLLLIAFTSGCGTASPPGKEMTPQQIQASRNASDPSGKSQMPVDPHSGGATHPHAH